MENEFIFTKKHIKLVINYNFFNIVINFITSLNINIYIYIMKILLTSTQSPGNGGAATNLYKLNKYFLEQNINVYCLFFLCNKEDTDIINIDPDNLGNVSFIRCFWKDGRLLDYDKNTNQYIEYSNDYKNNFKEKIITYLGGEPDIVWAKNYMSPITSKILFPDSKIYYLVSGVYFMSLLNNFSDENISAQKVLQNWDSYEKKINSYKDTVDYTNIKQELKTIKMVDGIIFNSTLTKQLLKLFYKDNIKNYEIKNTSLMKDLNNDSCDFTQREYDIIFVCSQLWRKIKNPNFAKELFLDKRLENYNKIVIGDGDLFDGLSIKNLTIMKQQPNYVVLDYMKKSKLLLLPSLFDSSPNTLYEAIECGCNILTSKNIGNWELFNQESICDDVYNKNEWLTKIENNLIKQISNNFGFENLLSNKKVIICYHLKDYYNLSYPVLFNYLGIKKNKTMFTENNIELIDFKEFLSEEDINIVESSNKNNKDIDYVSYVQKAVSNLVDIMRNNDTYDNSILIGFQNIGSDYFFYRKGHCQWDYYDIFKSKGCKFVMWMDDLHGFPNFPNISDYDENKDYSKCSDYRLDLLDKIITPSRHYYELLNSQYLNKTIQYFYCLNEDWYTEIDINNFKNRENKILLTGSTSAYPIRLKIYNISREEKHNFSNLITVLHSPGYNRNNKDFYSKVGINYLKIIAKYKGVFFGYAEKPLSFNLAKIIEILMCGSIGFFEFSPLLEKELGLIAFKHYVPITNDDGKLIEDVNYYLKYLNSKEGEQIALNGANYVREEFTSKRRINQLISILKDM